VLLPSTIHRLLTADAMVDIVSADEFLTTVVTNSRRPLREIEHRNFQSGIP
jgi:hypothetical protein